MMPKKMKNFTASDALNSHKQIQTDFSFFVLSLKRDKTAKNSSVARSRKLT